MSTRRARVVYLDELIDECIERAYSEVKKRRGEELSEEKMKKIAEKVGVGSIRYNIIKVQPEKDIVFKWEEALNFEGNAVPFIQYAHARACSILIKSKELTFGWIILTCLYFRIRRRPIKECPPTATGCSFMYSLYPKGVTLAKYSTNAS